MHPANNGSIPTNVSMGGNPVSKSDFQLYGSVDVQRYDFVLRKLPETHLMPTRQASANPIVIIPRRR